MTRNHEIVPSLYTRFVRLHAVEWHQLICMRVEFIGCKGTYNFSKPLNCGKGHVNTKNTKNRRTSSSNIKCGLTILPSVFFQCVTSLQEHNLVNPKCWSWMFGVYVVYKWGILAACRRHLPSGRLNILVDQVAIIIDNVYFSTIFVA